MTSHETTVTPLAAHDVSGASKALRRLYVVIEVNLVLWMVVTAMAYFGEEKTKGWALIGFVFAALAQHWAYYAVRNANRPGSL